MVARAGTDAALRHRRRDAVGLAAAAGGSCRAHGSSQRAHGSSRRAHAGLRAPAQQWRRARSFATPLHARPGDPARAALPIAQGSRHRLPRVGDGHCGLPRGPDARCRRHACRRRYGVRVSRRACSGRGRPASRLGLGPTLTRTLTRTRTRTLALALTLTLTLTLALTLTLTLTRRSWPRSSRPSRAWPRGGG